MPAAPLSLTTEALGSLVRRQEGSAARRRRRLRRAQTAVEIQDAVVCKLVGGEKDGRVGNLGGIGDPAEGRIFKESLLELRLEIWQQGTTGLYISQGVQLDRRTEAALGGVMAAGSLTLPHVAVYPTRQQRIYADRSRCHLATERSGESCESEHFPG